MKKSILFESSFFSYTVFIYSQNIPSRNDTEKAWTAVKQVANVSEAPGRCVQRKTHVGPYFCLEPQISFVILLKMSLPHNRPNKATLIFFYFPAYLLHCIISGLSLYTLFLTLLRYVSHSTLCILIFNVLLCYQRKNRYILHRTHL